MKLIMEQWRSYLKEDSTSYIKDMIGSQETGEINPDHSVSDHDDYEDGKGSNVKGKKAIKSQKKQKDLFRKHADHEWLSTLNTVHWAMRSAKPDTLMNIGSKDELSTTMSLPNEMLRVYGDAAVGLWIKGRITWATNSQDATWSGQQGDYKWTDQQVKSSGRNKRPMSIQRQDRDGWQGMLDKGELSDLAKKGGYLPVLELDNWKPSRGANEAIVDNWKPYAVVINTPSAGDYFQLLRSKRGLLEYFEQTYGKLARSYGIPVVARGKSLILPANTRMRDYLKNLPGGMR